MFLLSKLFAWVFLTPLLFIWPIMFSLLLIKYRKTKLAVGLLIVNCFMIYGLSLGPVTDALIKPLEDTFPPNMQSENYEVIVVLGGGILNSTPEMQGKPALSSASLQRALVGWKLFKQRKAPLIVCGGRPLDQEVPESQVMAQFLRELGVPANYIYQESKSRNTYENIKYLKPLLPRASARIALVTSAMHLPRAVSVAQAQDLRVLPVPCDYRSDRSGNSWYVIFPETNNLLVSFSAIKEYIGLWHYRHYYHI